MYKCKVVWWNGAATRTGPYAGAPRVSLLSGYRLGQTFYGTRLVVDSDDPYNTDKLWVEDMAGGYVAVKYPSSTGPAVRVVTEILVNSGRAQLMHDDQIREKFRDGLPETFGLFVSQFLTFNRAWQKFWFEQFKICSPRRPGETETVNPANDPWLNRLKAAYAGVIKNGRALTDRHAPQNGYADFINGVNEGAGGIGVKTIDFGGNIYTIIGGPYSKGGVPHWQIETLDFRKPPPDPKIINRLTRPDLIHACTNRSHDTLPSGLRRVDPFDQLQGDDVPMVLASIVPQFVRADYVRFIAVDESPSPYVR